MVPGFGKKGTGTPLVENMVLAIEIIYAEGSAEVGLEKDNWTISTIDRLLGGLFEQTEQVLISFFKFKTALPSSPKSFSELRSK